ncbi:LysR family transcriptional regulator [Bordetella petrii]|uniref:LysR family transcriptional regulator n=1 Tax=Bordetella petrii TaxID=94624 RepID=UPI001E4645B9|nr:LysR family transcriptional regulator [Bordetella petrii]MCD0502860.1 LysR family transcriptional regulator [Bordetella petrii]
MARQTVSLDDIFLFVEVAKRRGFTAASEAIGLPIATISRRISNLEHQLGLKLLSRSTRKVQLTAVGMQYFQACEGHVESALQAHRKVNDYLERPEGELRVSLPPGLSTFLPVMVAELRRQYPLLSYDFDLGTSTPGTDLQGQDLALRFGPQADSPLIQRPVARLRWVMVAAKTYLDHAGRPASPEDLRRHERIITGNDETWNLRRGDHACRLEGASRIRSNNAWLGVGMAAAGAGVALMPSHRHMARTLADQGLEQILPEWELPGTTLYALFDSRATSARARVFLDALARNLDTSPLEPSYGLRFEHPWQPVQGRHQVKH